LASLITLPKVNPTAFPDTAMTTEISTNTKIKNKTSVKLTEDEEFPGAFVISDNIIADNGHQYREYKNKWDFSGRSSKVIGRHTVHIGTVFSKEHRSFRRESECTGYGWECKHADTEEE
jgi:hypothetical protein